MHASNVKSMVRTDRKSCPSPHSTANKIARLGWQAVWLLLFRPSPWFWHGGRRLLLRLFGARVGRGVQIMPSVKIWAPWNLSLGDFATVSHGVDVYNVACIQVGAHATISQRACLCTATHEVHHFNMPLVTVPIEVCDGAWIAAEAFIHPGVTVGVDSVVGARAVVRKHVATRAIVAGNPAVGVGERRFDHG